MSQQAAVVQTQDQDRVLLAHISLSSRDNNVLSTPGPADVLTSC